MWFNLYEISPIFRHTQTIKSNKSRCIVDDLRVLFHRIPMIHGSQVNGHAFLSELRAASQRHGPRCHGLCLSLWRDQRCSERRAAKTLGRMSMDWFERKLTSGWWFGCHQFYFPILLGISSSQLTFIFFRGVQTTNQTWNQRYKLMSTLD